MTDSVRTAVKRDGSRECRCCSRGMADHGVIFYRVRIRQHVLDFRAMYGAVTLRAEADVLVCADCSLRTPVAAMLPDRVDDL